MVGYEVIAEDNYDTEEACTKIPWAEWIQGYCFRLFKNNGNEQSCDGFDGNRTQPPDGTICQYSAADDKIHLSMEEFGVDLADYYEQSFLCATQGDRSDTELITLEKFDGRAPLCWYNPVTTYMHFGSNRPLTGNVPRIATQSTSKLDWPEEVAERDEIVENEKSGEQLDADIEDPDEEENWSPP